MLPLVLSFVIRFLPVSNALALENLKKTVAGAASTSVNLGLCVGVEAKGNAIETLDVDYILVKANRDWNA